MASKEQINNQKELNEQLNRTKDLEKELADLRRCSVAESFNISDEIKSQLGIRSRIPALNKEIARTSLAISKELLNQVSSLSDISTFNKQNIRNSRLLGKQEALNAAIMGQITSKAAKKRIDEAVKAAKQREDFLIAEKRLEIELSELSGEARENKIKELEAQRIIINNSDVSLSQSFAALKNDKERVAFQAKLQEEQLRANVNIRKATLESVEPASQFFDILRAIPGVAGIADKAFASLVSKVEQQVEAQGKAVEKSFVMRESLKQVGLTLKKAVLNPTVILGGLFASIVKSFFEINQLQTEFQRLTGESANILRFTSNPALVSASDQLRTLVGLTNQFGFNAQEAFDQINIQEASELEFLLGLSAEEAGKLAFLTQSTGQNLNKVANEINDSTSGALSVRNVLQDVASVSSSIALTFGKSVELLGRAAAQARLLGLNLTQVDSVASRLLDIESSIAAEFEAEVITGKQLNLERARFFALTNDLAGLTEEISKNEEILSIFATGTRIEQEAIANAMGLSRDEISKMIQDQRILGGLTAEQIEQRDLEQKKVLSLQQSIAKSIEKLTEPFAILAEFVANLLNNSKLLLITLGAIGAVSLVKLVGSLIGLSAVLAKTFGLTAGVASALTLGLGALAVGAGIITIVTAAAQAQNKIKQIGDAVIPSSGRPIVSTREGGLFQGTANDDVLMGPGLARDRNTRGTVILSDQQIKQIADAVRDGASRATITMDGGKVSSRLQTPMIVNTLPGV